MPPKKEKRNQRIVRLRDDGKLSFTRIAEIVSKEFDPISRQYARVVYRREKLGIQPLAGTYWTRAQKEKAAE